MTNLTDIRIKEIVLKRIIKSSMNVDSWKLTRLSNYHLEVLEKCSLYENEIPIITCYINESSWYAFTTQRVIGEFNGRFVDLSALEIQDIQFPNFKGYENRQTEIMIIKIKDRSIFSYLEFETGAASMAPMYGTAILGNSESILNLEKWLNIRESRRRKLNE